MNGARIVSLAIALVVAAAAFADPRARIEELYQLGTLAQLRPGVHCKMFSSYDRTGGNNDGFSGKYSYLRRERGNSVIAEMSGPGAIVRIWFTHSDYKEDGLLNRRHEHIRVYLDGKNKPAIDVRLEDLFSGKLKAFPKPLVGSGLGGFYCYVPITYRRGCKVVLDGKRVNFYHLQYLEFPNADNIKSFSMNMTRKERKDLAKAVKLWSHLGDVASLDLKQPQDSQAGFDVDANKPFSLPLPDGPRMVRAIRIEHCDLKTAHKARITLTWDGATKPAVDLPLTYFFGQAFDPQPFQSLLFGTTASGYYNFMPMPYGSKATVRIASPKPLKGRITVTTTPLPGTMRQYGYFHGLYHEKVPILETDPPYVWLHRDGTGQYVGTYLVTDGNRPLPYWMEGDEQFVVDGQLAIHGTGSEDYFNCGWYAVKGRLNHPGAMPLHGFPVYNQSKIYSRVVAYRWQMLDAVPYKGNIYASIEHGGEDNVEANYRSATFFYDTAPGE